MDKAWYYAVAGTERQGPVSDAQLRELIQQGKIGAADLVWTEGMPSWVALGSVPDLQPAGTAAVASVANVAPPAFAGWLTFVGVLNIVGGAFTCMTCFGLPMGILMILAGAAALGAKTALQQLPTIDPVLSPLLQKFRTYFLMTGWAFILHIVMVVLMLIVYAGVFAAMFANMNRMMK